MKVLLHDLSKEELKGCAGHLLTDDMVVLTKTDKMPIKCCGCFNCWLKNPGVCAMKDGYENMGELWSKCDEFIIISKCVYGEFSIFVKRLIDRSLPLCYPFFCKREGKMHHELRYNNHPQITVYFYSDDMTQAEQKVAKERVLATGINFGSSKEMVTFLSSASELKEVKSW